MEFRVVFPRWRHSVGPVLRVEKRGHEVDVIIVRPLALDRRTGSLYRPPELRDILAKQFFANRPVGWSTYMLNM